MKLINDINFGVCIKQLKDYVVKNNEQYWSDIEGIKYWPVSQNSIEKSAFPSITQGNKIDSHFFLS